MSTRWWGPGHSYGGGVLKLGPTEAEALLVPAIPEVAAEELDELDELLRHRAQFKEAEPDRDEEEDRLPNLEHSGSSIVGPS